MTELEVAVEAARRGGELAASFFRRATTMARKTSYNLVTDADVAVEAVISEIIRHHFPHHHIWGEESNHQAHAQTEHLWLVDPIDGTNNFLHGIEQFAVSIAYIEAGQPTVGVVHNPLRGDWYQAVRGQPATHNGHPLQVSGAGRLDEALVGVGFYYDRGVLMRGTLATIEDLFGRDIHGIRRFGAASLDLCAVASGQFDAYFEFELAPWDFAAGRLIVEQAGGRVTTCHGQELVATKSSLLATNGRLHPDMLSVVAPRYSASVPT
jgi:myo-inositol-1(or 4)-monophosphatase